MGGQEAVAEIRRLEGAARQTPIVSMTAGDPDDCPHRCLECGMDDRLDNPMRLESLMGALLRWIPLADQQIYQGELNGGGPVWNRLFAGKVRVGNPKTALCYIQAQTK